MDINYYGLTEMAATLNLIEAKRKAFVEAKYIPYMEIRLKTLEEFHNEVDDCNSYCFLVTIGYSTKTKKNPIIHEKYFRSADELLHYLNAMEDAFRISHREEWTTK